MERVWFLSTSSAISYSFPFFPVRQPRRLCTGPNGRQNIFESKTHARRVPFTFFLFDPSRTACCCLFVCLFFHWLPFVKEGGGFVTRILEHDPRNQVGVNYPGRSALANTDGHAQVCRCCCCCCCCCCCRCCCCCCCCWWWYWYCWCCGCWPGLDLSCGAIWKC